MRIIRKITVKQVLTEESKSSIQKKLHNEKDMLKKECEQLLFEQKKMEHSKKGRNSSLQTSFLQEIERREDQIESIRFQLEQLEILPLGTELRESEIEALIEVNEGDSWDRLVKEIVIENGIVKEIRKG
ncbi:YlqD family protein [Bacillus carboniphilus]|uniref:YlqD family protein n=1 Tax=Bacillus carboniphilus TaxID=86663 RepID=A0ABP3G2R5_9BACI